MVYSFRLTIRNVNGTGTGVTTVTLAGFRLTIRNVNMATRSVESPVITGFRLTIRNVNENYTDIKEKSNLVLD